MTLIMKVIPTKKLLWLCVFAAGISLALPISPHANAAVLADPMLARQSHMLAIEAPGIQSWFLRTHPLKTQVTIAIVDTGMDMDHPDLKDNLWTNLAELNGQPGKDDDGNGYVDDIHGYNFISRIGDPSHQMINDHGTHVAGLAAAAMDNGIGGSGVMGKNLHIMVLNVFGPNWSPNTNAIAEAISYAANNGAQVINVSIGGQGETPKIKAAIEYAIQRGSTVVTSAGNNNLNIDENVFSPATYSKNLQGLISVGAVDSQTGALCPFSNYGVQSVEIAAPGCDSKATKGGLFSTRGGHSYGYKTGTSVAAPLVSASAALLWAYLSDVRGHPPTPAEIEYFLLQRSFVNPLITGYIKDSRTLNLKILFSK